MTISELLCIYLMVFYFVPGLATYIKLFRYGAAQLFCRFIFLLPAQGYYISFRVLAELFEHLTKERIIASRNLASNYYIVLRTWLSCLPVFFAQIGLIVIDNSNAIQHKIKRTSNECRENLISDLKEKYA